MCQKTVNTVSQLANIIQNDTIDFLVGETWGYQINLVNKCGTASLGYFKNRAATGDLLQHYQGRPKPGEGSQITIVPFLCQNQSQGQGTKIQNCYFGEQTTGRVGQVVGPTRSNTDRRSDYDNTQVNIEEEEF